MPSTSTRARPTGALLLGAVPALAAACGDAVERPHVALIVLDTVRRDHLSCYGYERPTTPTLEALAAEATLYENAVSAAPWTLPSHASLFTGRSSSRHGAHHEHLSLAEENVTLAERLAELGYETAQTGMTQGFERFEEVWRTQVAQGTFNLNVFVDEERHGFRDAGAAETLTDIRAFLEERDEERPLFLFVNLIEAHSVYDPPGEDRNRFTERPLEDRDVKRLNRSFPTLAHRDELTPRVLAEAQALYDGELAYLDRWMGSFLDLLRERGMLDATLLVVTSDHGEGFGEHRLCDTPLVDHQLNLYEEVLAVPLIVRFPTSHGAAGQAPGTRVAAPVSTLDVVPTVLDVVGVGAPADLEGISLARGAPPADRTLVSEYFRPLVHLDLLRSLVPDTRRVKCLADRRVAVVRRGPWKLVLDSRGEELLYDLGSDPGEERPVAGEDATLTAEARARLEAMEASFEPLPEALGAAQREALRALGYLR
jgi:arylsulfatase A-like enzyme